MGCQNCVHYIQGEKGNEITKEPPVIVSNEIPTGELKKKDEIEKTTDRLALLADFINRAHRVTLLSLQASRPLFFIPLSYIS